MDYSYGNIEMLAVGNNALLIPVTDPKKVAGFKRQLAGLKMPEADKRRILTGLNNGTATLAFFKDPNGFDDKLLVCETKKIRTVIKGKVIPGEVKVQYIPVDPIIKQGNRNVTGT